jgi:hypothetical protein
MWQAHEIDGVLLARTGKGQVARGDLVEVRIDAVEDDYDLRGTIMNTHATRPPASRLPIPASRRAMLPIAGAGSYGR